MTAIVYIVQVWDGRRWAKVRGPEGGPWSNRRRAERVAQAREDATQRTSSTDSKTHRVVERYV